MADASPTLVCPSCKAQIPLTESLAAPMIEAARKELEERAAAREHEVAERERALSGRMRELEAQREQLEAQIGARLATERVTLAAAEQKKARAALSDELERQQRELADRDARLLDREAKLAEARKKEVELLQGQRALEEQKATLALDVERRVQEERGKIREEARKGADEENRLRMAEREKTISDMREQIEEMRRKAEQGSQQQQGEVLELDFESSLRATFPQDLITPVPKGEFGGDVIHAVRTALGQPAGSILWELKRTKAFSALWLPKLRDDQRAAKADVAILVTEVLPKEIEIFGQHEGVWVTTRRAALPLASCLRQLLVELASAQRANEGLETKQSLVYQYMSGPRFRQRLHAIVEAFQTMRKDLDSEKRAINRQWAKREAQLERVLLASTGMYGDLEGIVGQAMPQLEPFELKVLEAPEDEAG